MAYEGALNNALAEARLLLPGPAVKGIYEPGDEFAFYKDLKDILTTAKNEVFIADNYLNSDFFELYVEPIPKGVTVRIMTDDARGNTVAVATKYASRGKFELRTSKDVHDRVVFIDGRCWLIGQSVKDAARKKPTYMVEYVDAAQMQAVYEIIWNKATTLVKGERGNLGS
jgi:hypothetical protein